MLMHFLFHTFLVVNIANIAILNASILKIFKLPTTNSTCFPLSSLFFGIDYKTSYAGGNIFTVSII